MKKLFVILMCLLLPLGGLAACGGSGNSGSSGDSENSDDSGAAEEATYLIRIASDETIDTPCSEATLIFKDLVETASEGRVTVEYFNDSAMGDEREIAESVQMGNLEMGIITGAQFATYDPNWFVSELPYVFMDRALMYDYLDGEVGDFLRDSLLAVSNIEVLDYADGSFKIILNKSKPVKTPEDLSGLKIRSMESKINMSLYNAWKGTAVPMGFSEIYTALQQGTVDGVDTSPLYQRSGKFYEVAKEYTLTNHQALMMVSIINTEYMNSLPEDIQQIIRDASHEAYTVKEREIVEAAEQYALSVMNDAGCVETVLSDAEREAFVAASRPVVEEYRNQIDPALYAMLGL